MQGLTVAYVQAKQPLVSNVQFPGKPAAMHVSEPTPPPLPVLYSLSLSHLSGQVGV
jgi:hypothetical protein